MQIEAPRIFLVAGEPSGDALGAGLIDAIKAAAPDSLCLGVGGPGMAVAGMELVFPYDDLAVMGLVEVLPRYFRIRRRWQQVMTAIAAFDPDVVVTIDSSGFNKPIAKRLIKLGSTSRRVHYVAPMVWAWRPGRAEVFAQLFHHLLVLFPFEPPYFTEHGLPTTYVGHPATQTPPGDGAAFRARHDIPADAPLLAVLPGSRKGELARLLPVFEQALPLIAAAIPDLHVVFPTVPLVADKVRNAASALKMPSAVTDTATEKADAFAASTAALAASGTITLELALAKVPMAVAYKVHPITAEIGKRVLKVKSAALPNLLSGRALVPEFLQHRCTPELLAEAVIALLREPARRAEQAKGFEEISAAMSTEGRSPSAVAAAMVLAEAAERRSAISNIQTV